MKTKAAETAKAIKAELKKAFPQIKFAVKSSIYSGGTSVDVDYTDGVAIDKVRDITEKYQYGHFDGMNDIYENSNRRNDIPQVKFVIVQRTKSDEVVQKIASEFNLDPTNWDHLTSIHRLFYNRDF